MSLINQMLRDLQGQKNHAPQAKKDMRSKKLERIPYLPLPLVLGAAGLILVLLIWWLAGALSEVMFGLDSTPGEQGQKIVKEPAESSPGTNPAEPVLTVVPDQLTADERVAEPVVVEKTNTEVFSSDEPVAVVQAAPPEKKLVAAVKRPRAVIKTVPSKSVSTKPVTKNQRKKAMSTDAQVRSIKKTASVAVKAPTRLHPDDLPGAISNAPPVEVAPAQLIGRPDRGTATTPYGNAENAYLDGLWALEKKRDTLAARSLQGALNIYPGHLKARELLAEMLSSNGKSGEAILLLKEGLEIAPDYIDFKKRYARLMVQQGDYDAATKALLQNGLPDIKEDPEAHTILASLYQKLGESFLAAQTYRNLLVFWPQTGAFWVGLGSALEGQGLRQEAAECYQRALETSNLRDDLNRYAKRRLRLTE